MNSLTETQNMELNIRGLNELRDDVARKQRCGLPFILASAVIWTLIFIVCMLIPETTKRNLLVFCCSCPLMPLAWIFGKN